MRIFFQFQDKTIIVQYSIEQISTIPLSRAIRIPEGGHAALDIDTMRPR